MIKTRELLLKVIEKHCNASVTVLMKACYLVDLVSTQRTGNQVTDLEYIRYTYGPFSQRVYGLVMDLIASGYIESRFTYLGGTNESEVYSIKDGMSPKDSALTEEENLIIDEVLASISGLGAKVLTDIAYKTAPMRILGATLGGNENIGKVLDLRVKL